MMDFSKILEGKQKVFTNMLKNLSASAMDMKGMQELITKELSPEQKEIVSEFNKEAAGLDLAGLEKLRKTYSEKLKDGPTD